MPKARQKRLTVEQQQYQQWLIGYRDAQPMKNYAPTVEAIRIEMNYVAADSWGKPAPKAKTILPEHQAYFKMECPQSECVWGGFDLTAAVNQAIAKRLEEDEGKVVCMGWEDTSRINQFHCLYECHYRISITYKPV